MNFKDFLRDQIGLIIFDFTFLLFTITVIIFSPINEPSFDIIVYITILNFALLLIYILISYFRKLKFLNSLDKGLSSHNLNTLNLIKNTNEENIYLDIIKDYQNRYEYMADENWKKFKENTEIMSMWVHDIKMPISIIKLIIEQNQNPYCEKVLDEVDNEVMRIENAVERVLYLSRLDDFHKDFLVQGVNLEKTVREVIRKYSKYFISKKIKLDLSNLNYNVLSDKKWLSFIFDQLINNALKYLDSQGNISIVGEVSNGYISIKIKDSGCGIKKEDLNRIFNKGFTGNNGRNNAKSTGLGLYLVKELCDKLDHLIYVDSIYGEFTEFVLTLRQNI